MLWPLLALLASIWVRAGRRSSFTPACHAEPRGQRESNMGEDANELRLRPVGDRETDGRGSCWRRCPSACFLVRCWHFCDMARSESEGGFQPLSGYIADMR